MAGLLLYAGHPPLGYGWAGALALVPLLLLARDLHEVRDGFAWGLVAGLVFFAPLLSWIGRFGGLAWGLLSLTQALFVGLFVAGLVAWQPRAARGAWGVVWWVGLEALRSSVPLSGMPWGVLGYTQHDGGLLLPLARSLGVLGVSAALATIAVLLEAAVVRAWRQRERGGEAIAAALRWPLAGMVAVLAASVLLAGEPLPVTGVVDIAAVQGNDVDLPPLASDRTSVTRIVDVATRQLAVTRRLADDPPEVAVWPENALDADPRTSPELGAIVDEALDVLDGAPLLAGVLLPGPRDRTFQNAMAQIAPDGSVVDVYVKRVLVPFGEYVPFRSLLGDLGPLRQIPSDGVAGDEPDVFDVGGAQIGPVTCFESIFPALVSSQVRAGAEVLVVSTNNAPFGRTPASRQHLAFSQLRAVETGRWVLHAGISGLSAVVSPTGEVSQRTELFEPSIVRAELPLVTGLTPAVRIGDRGGQLAMLLSAAGVAWLLSGRVAARRRAGYAASTSRLEDDAPVI